MKRAGLFLFVSLLGGCEVFNGIDEHDLENVDTSVDDALDETTVDSASDETSVGLDSSVDSSDDVSMLETSVGDDTGSEMTDSGTNADSTVDATDSALPDVGPETDASSDTAIDAACTGPSSQACGKCGTQTRTCTGGVWSAWGTCGGEKECAPGDVVPGGACSGALEKSTKKCNASCTYDADVCAIPKGWTKIADSGSIAGRLNHSAVWTGGELIVYGGSSQLEGGTTYKDGAMYRLNKNTWETIPTPSVVAYGRREHIAVWSGASATMLIWGGYDGTNTLGDGLEYSPATKSWSAMAVAPIVGRRSHSGIYVDTLHKFFVWGGTDASGKALADGAEYDVVARSWAKLPAAPIAARRAAAIFWSGTEIVLWGGSDAALFADGAAYNPTSKTWRSLPLAPTGGRSNPTVALTTSNKLVVFGGLDSAGTATDDGAKAGVAAPVSWSSIGAPAVASYPMRSFPSAWSFGETVVLWSGSGASDLVSGGATYDASASTWTVLPTAGAPLPRMYATTATTSSCGILWSGYGKPGGGVLELLTDGAIYCP